MTSRVGALIAANGGVITARNLNGIGVSGKRIRDMVRRGVLVPVRKGVYTLPGIAAAAAAEPAREHALRLAAVLAGSPGSSRAGRAGSHWTAASIHGLWLLDWPPAGQTAVTCAPAPGMSRGRRPGVCLHVAELPPAHVVRRHGVPVTSVARTVIDIARAGEFADGVVAGDSALHAGDVSPAELELALAECEHWPGTLQAGKVIAFCDQRSESPLESFARVIMYEHGLPPPELQVWITDKYGSDIARVDFFWPESGTVAEADGAVKYEKDGGRAARNQLRRDQRLRDEGHEVFHFGWQEVRYGAKAFIGNLEAAFARGQR